MGKYYRSMEREGPPVRRNLYHFPPVRMLSACANRVKLFNNMQAKISGYNYYICVKRYYYPVPYKTPYTANPEFTVVLTRVVASRAAASRTGAKYGCAMDSLADKRS
jgi:hypothetical protein